MADPERLAREHGMRLADELFHWIRDDGGQFLNHPAGYRLDYDEVVRGAAEHLSSVAYQLRRDAESAHEEDSGPSESG
jgi:hypothetical protein